MWIDFQFRKEKAGTDPWGRGSANMRIMWHDRSHRESCRHTPLHNNDKYCVIFLVLLIVCILSLLLPSLSISPVGLIYLSSFFFLIFITFIPLSLSLFSRSPSLFLILYLSLPLSFLYPHVPPCSPVLPFLSPLALSLPSHTGHLQPIKGAIYMYLVYY